MAGDRRNLNKNKWIAYEREDWVSQKLRNPYEESKLRAEIYLREKGKEFGLEFTCYRISVAVGRYENGFANNFSGYYNFCKFITLRDRMQNGFREVKPIEMRVPKNATVNICCVDWMATLIAEISKKKESVGKVFHISNPDPPKSSWLMIKSLDVLSGLGIRVDGIKIFTYDDSLKKLAKAPESPIEMTFSYYQDYAESEIIFDNTNVRAVLGYMPKHPKIDERLIKRLLKFAVSKNFGRPLREIHSKRLLV